MSTQDPQWGGGAPNYGGSPGGGGSSSGNFGGPGGHTGDKPNNLLWLLLNIGSFFLCSLGFLFSIPGAIFAGIGLSKEQTDPHDSARKARIAKILFFVSLAVGLLGLIALVVFVGVLGNEASQNFESVGGQTDYLE